MASAFPGSSDQSSPESSTADSNDGQSSALPNSNRPNSSDEGDTSTDNENEELQVKPTTFNPQKTVVFYPLYTRFPRSDIKKLIRFFGEVEVMTFYTKEEVGCVVVVYKKTASVYSAWNCVRELKDYLNLVQFIHVDFLWDPAGFSELRNEIDENMELDVAVKENRAVQIPLLGGMDADVIQKLPFYGPIETFRITTTEDRSLFHATFKYPIDAIVCVAIENDLSSRLYVGKSQQGEEVLAKPSAMVRFPEVAYIGEYELETVYRNINTSYLIEIKLFSEPITVFGNAVTPETPPAIRLPTMGNEVSSVFIAIKKSKNLFKYYELKIDVEAVSSGGMELTNENKGSQKWVSYFYLEIERWFCATHHNYRLEVRFRSVNYIFPKIYPQMFLEENSYNFTFATPMRYTLVSSSRDDLTRSRELYAEYLDNIDGGNNVYNSYKKPYICFLIPNSADCCNSSSCIIPVVVHSKEVNF